MVKILEQTNKRKNELAVDLVVAWLAHNSEISNEIGRTSVKGNPVTTKEVAQAYLDFFKTITNNELPKNLTNENQ